MWILLAWSNPQEGANRFTMLKEDSGSFGKNYAKLVYISCKKSSTQLRHNIPDTTFSHNDVRKLASCHIFYHDGIWQYQQTTNVKIERVRTTGWSSPARTPCLGNLAPNAHLRTGDDPALLNFFGLYIPGEVYLLNIANPRNTRSN